MLASGRAGVIFCSCSGPGCDVNSPPGGHDDIANAAAGALLLTMAKLPKMRAGAIDPDGIVHWRDDEPRDHSRIRWITVDEDGNEVRR